MQDAVALEDEEEILVDQLKKIYFDQSQETQQSLSDCITGEPNDQCKKVYVAAKKIVKSGCPVDVKLPLQISNKYKSQGLD